MSPLATQSRPLRLETGVNSKRLDQLRVHMIGIGGCGMSGLAALLLRRGATVTGTDRQPSAELARLADAGARVSTLQHADAIPPETELVVASAAIPPDHPERLAALQRGLPVIKYAELLGLIMKHYEGVAISGTHGKSTTTAWVAFLLRRAGLDPNFVVGATAGQLGGGSGVGDGPHFVVEACEYDRSFLNLSPRLAVVLNIEEDHLDCYRDLGQIVDAFAAFVRRVPPDGLVILNAESPGCRAIASHAAAATEWFGDRPDADWRAVDADLVAGRYAFTAVHRSRPLGRVHLALSGRHNVDNALAVAAIATRLGVPWEQVAAGLGEFRGAQRRLELRGEVRGVRIVDDYGHHPTEIRATLLAARERFQPARLWCVFQPHQHSRTRFLLADFARSFSDADEVIVPDIYFVRDTERERELVSAADLVARIAEQGRSASHVADFGAIVDRLAREVRPGDVVLTMGAGNIWKVADELVRRLGGDL